MELLEGKKESLAGISSDKLGMAGWRSRRIVVSMVVENFSKIRFDSFIADYYRGGKLTPGEKISGKTVLPRFLTIVIAPTRHVGPSSFCFRHPSFIFRPSLSFSRQMFQCSRWPSLWLCDVMLLPSLLSFFHSSSHFQDEIKVNLEINRSFPACLSYSKWFKM